ncbi:winged helix DNA-binding domain-containing protein [Microlunatus sp. Gsoil 973]|uniref:winged helix DNA-binding domain-containing protein n=1 Tax=Microlunatus sp. Gsoil 973 TaxID=2672569 RepID=UPI0018A8804C|nr:winged helix DNA-binding domain-containing protein [Microlunatus sp. Gsoil 973]
MALTEEQVRTMTLARQFPSLRGHGRRQLLELFDRLGPIQSQVPRAPFLTAASRLPGVSYRTINQAFADHLLLKTTSLRGTVHTTVVDQFAAVDATRRPRQARDLGRLLGIDAPDVCRLTSVIESFCGDSWQPRDAVVDRVREAVAEHNPEARLQELDQSYCQNLVWGHSGLIRRPRDHHWELRTDGFHRTARRVVPTIPVVDHDAAVTALTRVHLGSYGPAGRKDIAWWLGVPLGTVDRAVTTLGEELVRHTGPDGSDLLDLAVVPKRRRRDPGLRLLPEFDGLLLGYAPEHRDRFLDQVHLDKVWARANGLFSPTVLLDGRIVGGWRTVGRPAGTIIEITPLHRSSGIETADTDAAVQAVAQALDLVITDVRILPPQD